MMSTEKREKCDYSNTDDPDDRINRMNDTQRQIK